MAPDTGRSVRANSGYSFGISQFLMDTLENRPEHINVVVDEVGLDNWRFAGKLSSEWRKQSEKNEADRAANPPADDRVDARKEMRDACRRCT